jgi:outer membrane protein TolC
LALEEYSSGLVDMMTLLESQRRSYDARSALLEVSTQRLLNRVNLYLALGVDIEIENDPSPAMDQGWFVSSSVN